MTVQLVEVDTTLARPEPARRARGFWRGYFGRRAAVVGAVICGGFVVMAVAGPLFAPYPSQELHLDQILQGPSSRHLFGTDSLGRDVLSEVIIGARTSVVLAAAVMVASTILGVLIGAAAGYLGGWPDMVLSRVIDMFLVIPRFLLAIVLVAVLGSSVRNIFIALTAALWPVMARMVRGEYIRMKSRTFVEAARAVGVGHPSIVFGEILPSVLPVIVVTFAFLMSQAILSEAGLSFLGLYDPQSSSWGRMVFSSQGYVARAWWISVFPGLAIALFVLSLNLIGDSLNEVINPRTARRKVSQHVA
jgi:peptide/nickel transport system permease protein